MAFRVGQKVICVDIDPPPEFRGMDNAGWGKWEAPELGSIYTVRRCFVCARGVEVLWLDEIERDDEARAQLGEDAGYGACRFRPVVERKTDISVFTEMLREQENVA